MEIKNYLLKEAEDRISIFCKQSGKYSKQSGLNSLLLKEAEKRIDTAKNIMMQKDAMAFTAGTLETKNADNIIFEVPQKSNRIRKIEQDLNNAFLAYFKQITLSNNNRTIKALPPKQVITISEDETKEQGEPTSTLRFEVRFKRDIYPVKQKPLERAKGAINLIDQIVPGMSNFVEFLRRENITPLPYYHRNISGQEQKILDKGNAYEKDKITTFIKDQQEKYRAAQFLTLPDGTKIDTSGYYTEHNSRIANGEKINVTHQDRSFQLFSADNAFDIQYPTYLMRAIAGKIWFGYRLDEEILDMAIEKEKQKFLKAHNITHSGKTQYNVFYENLKNKIINEFNKAISSAETSKDLIDNKGKAIPTSQINPEWSLGKTRDGKSMRGFRLAGVSEKIVNGKVMHIPTKHSVCMDLNLRELQFMLFALQAHNKDFEQPAVYRQNKINLQNVPEDQFFISGYSITVNANGFDTDTAYARPGYSGTRMSIVPPLRASLAGMDYDSDQGNLGRNMIVTYGAKTFESGDAWQHNKPKYSKLEKLLQEYGEWAVKALATLQVPSETPRSRMNIFDETNENNPEEKKEPERLVGKNIGPLYKAWKNKSNFIPYEVWAKIIGTDKNSNRTSAETFVEKILYNEAGQLRDNQQFKDFLLNSGASQINSRRKSTSSVNIGGISDALLPLLQKYGYAIAKMMDFVFAVMIRSSATTRSQSVSPMKAKKIWEERSTEVPPDGVYPTSYDIRQFGANYSVGTGKSEYGKILIGIKYAIKAEGLESNPGIVQEIVKKYKGAYHLPSGKNHPDPFSGSVTVYPERGNLQPFQLDEKYIKIVDDLSFWIGYSGSTSGRAITIADNIDNFYDALSALDQRYPQVFDEVGAIFDPISLNLKLLREKTKACLTKITGELNRRGIDIKTILINQQTHETTLCSTVVGEGVTDVAEKEVERAERRQQNIQQPPAQQPIGRNPTPPREPNIPDATQPELPTPGPQLPATPVDETPRPMPMKVNKHNKRQLFKNIEPQHEKIRKSSLVEKLIKLSDKIDEKGKHVISNKIDTIIRWLGKNNVS